MNKEEYDKLIAKNIELLKQNKILREELYKLRNLLCEYNLIPWQ